MLPLSYLLTVAIYSCNIFNIQRSKNKSLVARAAYNSRSKLLDIRTNKTCNHSRKQNLGFSKIITPKNTPAWANDRQRLWSKNELSNKRKGARVAKEILIALPRELNASQQQNLVRKFVNNNLIPLGVVTDIKRSLYSAFGFS